MQGNSYPQHLATTSSNNKRSDKCFKCNEPGHWSRDCPGTKQLASRAPTVGAIGTERSKAGSRCYGCGEHGHWSRDCPKKQQQHQSSSGADAPRWREETKPSSAVIMAPTPLRPTRSEEIVEEEPKYQWRMNDPTTSFSYYDDALVADPNYRAMMSSLGLETN